MKYYHVDVFSSKPLQGNGLAVVLPDREIGADDLLQLAREFNQFETIFVYPKNHRGFPARIFTVNEELKFAGHPILGAGAVIHKQFFQMEANIRIELFVSGRRINVSSQARGETFEVTMSQGTAQLITRVSPAELGSIASALNLRQSDLAKDYPVEVVSTGLPYLLVPVAANLGKARIAQAGFDKLLARFGAKFAYLFDPQTLECRTWDNAGLVEDVATGSAAGPLVASLVNNGRKKAGEIIKICQGRYVGRPSVIDCWVDRSGQEVFIRGEVAFFAAGEIAARFEEV